MLETIVFLGGLALVTRIGREYYATNDAIGTAERLQQDAVAMLKQMR